MEISILGTRVLDNIVSKSNNNLIDKARVVEISPFSLYVEKPLVNRLFSTNDSYRDFLVNTEYNRSYFDIIRERKCELIIHDISAMRLVLREFNLKNGVVFRMTENSRTAPYLDKIREYLVSDYDSEIVSEVLVNPANWSDEKLTLEINKYIDYLKENLGDIRLINAEINLAYHYIDKSNRFNILSNLNFILSANKFLKRCLKIFVENYDGICHIDAPKYVFGNENEAVADYFNYSSNVISYYASCLNSALSNNAKKKDFEAIKNEFDNKNKLFIDKIILRPLVDVAFHKRNGRKLIEIGYSEVLDYSLKEKYGLIVEKHIDYFENCDIEQFECEISQYKNKHNEYMILVPFLYSDGGKILSALWKNGYGNDIGYYCTSHNIISLRGFCGDYSDFYGNRVSIDNKTDVHLIGIGSNVEIGHNSCNKLSRHEILNGVNFKIKSGYFEDINSTLYDGACLVVEENCKIKSKTHFRISFFRTTKIGRDSIIGEHCIFMNGDGHGIYDLKTGKNINYDLNNIKPEKNQIIFGDNVKIGANCFVLAGAHLNNNCTALDSSLINKSFPENTTIAGNPAAEVTI